MKNKGLKEKSATELLVDSVQDLADGLNIKVTAKPINTPTDGVTETVEITETVEEVAPVVLKGNELRLKHGQCAIKRKDGRGGICLVMEKHFESKYSKDWIKLEIESKKK